MGEKDKSPAIRFKGYTGEWEEHKLGDIANVLSASRVHKGEWVSGGVPFFRSSDVVAAYKGTSNDKVYISYQLYNELIKSSGKLEQGDILVTGGGSIGIPYIVPNNEPLYSKDADLIWIKKSGKHDGQYLYAYFESQGFRKYLSNISHIGTIAHYTIEQVRNTSVFLPEMNEQKGIGSLFGFLDSLIALHQRKYDQLVNVKKSMLRKMFPQNGQKVPEIRFNGFSDDWEQRRLGKVVDICSGKDYKHLTGGDVPVYGTGGYMLSVSEALSKNEDAIGIGRKGTIDNPYILKAPFWTVDTLFYCIPKKQYDLDYVYSIFQLVDWKAMDESTGVPSLSKTAISDVDVNAPSRIEQKMLGKFFRNLDSLIALHQRKLEILKNIKKSMLDKMFV